MKLVRTAIPDVVIVEPAVFGDERGWFFESFNERRLHAELGRLGLPAPRPFVQDNHSLSAKGILRGLHFQRPPFAQGKLVRVVRGAVFDVAVDIRPGSATFGEWAGVELSAINRRQLWIPEGLAHGFLALQDDTEFLYKTTDYYARESEGALLWSDPTIGIAWPDLAMPPSLNTKDAGAPLLADMPR